MMTNVCKLDLNACKCRFTCVYIYILLYIQMIPKTKTQPDLLEFIAEPPARSRVKPEGFHIRILQSIGSPPKRQRTWFYMFCACGCGNVWHVFYVCFLCLMLCLADCPCDTEDTCVRAAHHVKICENRLPISEDLHVAIVCWLHCIWLYCLPLM